MKRGHPGAALLAVTSICVSLLGIAFALHPVHVSPYVFWGLIGTTTFIALVAISLHLGRSTKRTGGRHFLTGLECRRLSDVIDSLWAERQAKRPKATGLVANSGSRQRQWVEETDADYDELKAWAMRVFEDAVACNAMSDASRPLIERPPAAQLHKVGDLFRDAADTLERA